MSVFPTESIVFYQKIKKKIVPVTDQTELKDAIAKLKFIKENNWSELPSNFRENWDRVALYNPSGNAAKATAIIMDINEGAYSLQNRLNHLTGKEWVKLSCSWFIFNALPSDLSEERAADPSAENHPAAFSPTMISDFICFFTKEGEIVFDPFMGIGTTLVASTRTKRVGFGVELNPGFYSTAIKRNPDLIKNMFNDSIEHFDMGLLPTIDFSISSPPYWDVLNRSTKDFRKNREKKQLNSTYSDEDADLGNIEDYKEFVSRLTDVYLKVGKRIRPKGFLVVIVKNVKKDGKLYPLAWDLAKELSAHFELKDERIWIQDKVSLAPYGYPHSWASNILHHYCLIFQKQ
jgi:DNA modification methylase